MTRAQTLLDSWVNTIMFCFFAVRLLFFPVAVHVC